jgi:hypothetical protein
MQRCSLKLAARKYFDGVWIANIREQTRKNDGSLGAEDRRNLTLVQLISTAA